MEFASVDLGIFVARKSEACDRGSFAQQDLPHGHSALLCAADSAIAHLSGGHCMAELVMSKFIKTRTAGSAYV